MPSPQPQVSCVLPARGFRVVWTLLVVLYSVVTLYLLAHATMYAVFYIFPITAYYTTTFQVLHVHWYPVVSAAYFATALLYIQQLLKIATSSLRHRELRFATSQAATTRPFPRFKVLESFTAKPRQLYAFLFGTSGLLSVRGPFFGIMTLVRETVEISVQVYQAYQSSRYSASLWINLTFGGLIVANCLSTPILHWWFAESHRHTGKFRLVVLSVDLALDLVWLLVLPFLFWLPYYNALRGTEALPFDDTFMPKALMELRFIFVTSFADLAFAKLLPALSVFFALRKMQSLVRVQLLARRSAVVKTRASRASASVSVAPLAQLVPTAKVSTKQQPYTNPMLEHLEKLLTMVLGATGLCAVILYFIAYAVYKPCCVQGCQVVLRPWFETNSNHCFCAVQEINCHTHGIKGSRSELTLTIMTLETRGLLSLIFTHCSDLTVPPSLTRFHDLYRLELFNCSITSWEEEAAPSAAAFPQLGIVSLVSTGITDIPPGLLQGDFPSTLREIQIVDSSLSTLPVNLGALWPHVTTLYLERAAFSEYPTALSNMPQLESLTLYANNISTIDDNAFKANHFVYLLFNANPLRVLPSSLRRSTGLTELQLMNMNISSITQATLWAGDGTDRSDVAIVYGLGSPFCEDASAGQSPLPARVVVDCKPKFKLFNGETSMSWYPFEGKLKQRQLVAT